MVRYTGMKQKGTYETIYRVISNIPRGKVATYGQIARLAGLGAHARLVGYALHVLSSKSPVPWHRVINARGEISLRSGGQAEQRTLLEKEGVVFDEQNRVSLNRYGWLPEDRRPKKSGGR